MEDKININGIDFIVKPIPENPNFDWKLLTNNEMMKEREQMLLDMINGESPYKYI